MARYLNPKADIVFKKIFGEHPHLLKSFLNAVLPLAEDAPIVELSYLPTESIPSVPLLKRTIADVRCKDKQGRVFIVEMQIEWTDSFKQRLLFEAGQAYIKQIKQGEDYHLLEPVYGLGLVATQFDKSEEWYHHYQLVNIQKVEREIIKDLQLVFIELPKFPITSKTEKQLRLLWLRFLREINEDTFVVSPDLLAVPEIVEALGFAEQAGYNAAELQAYESYWDAVSTEKTLLRGRYEEGIEVGALREKEGIAKNLLSLGLDIADISAATGLSAEEVLKIKSKI